MKTEGKFVEKENRRDEREQHSHRQHRATTSSTLNHPNTKDPQGQEDAMEIRGRKGTSKSGKTGELKGNSWKKRNVGTKKNNMAIDNAKQPLLQREIVPTQRIPEDRRTEREIRGKAGVSEWKRRARASTRAGASSRSLNLLLRVPSAVARRRRWRPNYTCFSVFLESECGLGAGRSRWSRSVFLDLSRAWSTSNRAYTPPHESVFREGRAESPFLRSPVDPRARGRGRRVLAVASSSRSGSSHGAST
ncbi:hypothetical protein KM043_010619 [Ampulex compressa]|nr:hypothetical protein KM043_010619 [Ampulex compressa]